MYQLPGFYRNAALLFASLLVTTLLVGYLCFDQTLLADRLLPASKSFLTWGMVANADSENNGQSTIQIKDATQSLDFDFTLSDTIAYGYASAAMSFNRQGTMAGLVDLSKYQLLRLHVQCTPANTLSFTAYAFDKEFTDLKDLQTYRIPTTFFNCDRDGRIVEIDLRHMEVPEWWFQLHKISITDRAYQLSHVSRFTFGVSVESPRNTLSSVKITGIELVRRDWTILYVFIGLASAVWLAYGFWLVKKHAMFLRAEFAEKIQKERPLIAYQQLSIEPLRDKEKTAVLHYMATEYANPGISLETAIATIGINRAKMNSILKEETGLTFSGYLNKLRLTEAARLLAEKPEANVAEIAFSVGYNNVTYFNKLFKNEYDCSPKTFKSAQAKKNEMQPVNLTPLNALHGNLHS